MKNREENKRLIASRLESWRLKDHTFLTAEALTDQLFDFLDFKEEHVGKPAFPNPIKIGDPPAPLSINPSYPEEVFERSFLTLHFKAKEFGLKLGIPLGVLSSYITLCSLIMEPIRGKFGLPITITSGYRTPQHNKDVGGVSKKGRVSEHVATANWCACDFRLNAPLEEVFDWIRLESGLPFRQVILERPSFDQDPSVIHISWNRVRPGRQAYEGLTHGRSRYYKREVRR